MSLPFIILVVGLLFVMALMMNVVRSQKRRREQIVLSQWEEEDDVDLLEDEESENLSSACPMSSSGKSENKLNDSALSSSLPAHRSVNQPAVSVIKAGEIEPKKINPPRPFIKRYSTSVTTPATDPSGEISANVKSAAQTATNQNKSAVENNANNIFVLYVMAHQGKQFVGYELLQSLLAVGLHFGDRDIFHRYSDGDTSNNKPLFSLASAVKPGTFDIDRIGGFSSPGLTLFMQITPDVVNPQFHFDIMLDTARQLADDLGGAVYDDKRHPWTDESLNQYKERLH